MNNSTVLLLALSLVIASGCKKEKPEKPSNPSTPGTPQPYDAGVFVVNEGPFSAGSGTVYHYNRSNRQVTPEIFQSKNSRPLGSIAQSLEFSGTKGFVVINNGSKVEVVNAGSFESIGTVSGLTSPRYVKVVGTKGYVSDWGQGGVVVFDLNDYSQKGFIPTGNGPEQMVYHDGYLYVTNNGDWTAAGFSVAVINTSNDSVEQQIIVGDKPNSIVIDKNQKIWVLCGGIDDWQNPNNNTAGVLARINPVTKLVEQTFSFTNTFAHPTKMSVNNAGDKLYFLSDLYSGAVYSIDISAAALPANPVVNRSFYGLGVDPKDGSVYAADPRDYSQNGWVIHYTASGAVIDSFEVGVIPGNFAFR